MSYELSAQSARQAVESHTIRLAESVRIAGPEAQVPTVPDWKVAALVEHLGQSQRWVAEILEQRIPDPSQLPTQIEAMPADPDSWRTWLGEGAARAAAAASDSALEAPVWNAAGDERTGGQFWLHSLLNEAVIHGFDAAAAAAGTATAAADAYHVDPQVASELISNHLAMLTSPTWAAQRSDSADSLRGNGQVLHWQATDVMGLATGDWFIERLPEGAQLVPQQDKADAIVSGPAKSLLLVLTRRLPVTGEQESAVKIEGDDDLVRHWIGHTAHIAG